MTTRTSGTMKNSANTSPKGSACTQPGTPKRSRLREGIACFREDLRQGSNQTHPPRHARACPGHPRRDRACRVQNSIVFISETARPNSPYGAALSGVDGRDKPGHEREGEFPSPRI